MKFWILLKAQALKIKLAMQQGNIKHAIVFYQRMVKNHSNKT